MNLKIVSFFAAGSLLLIFAAAVVAQKRTAVSVPEDVARQMVKDGVERADLRVEALDLNADGRPELIVQGGCAGVGNCSTYVFRRTRRGYEQLLNDDAQIFRTGKAGIRKYRDLVFQVHDSAYESHVSTYKFDGNQYRLKGCIDRQYSYIDNRGRWHLRKRPQLTKC
jgi:hypothetical protein